MLLSVTLYSITLNPYMRTIGAHLPALKSTFSVDTLCDQMLNCYWLTASVCTWGLKWSTWLKFAQFSSAKQSVKPMSAVGGASDAPPTADIGLTLRLAEEKCANFS